MTASEPEKVVSLRELAEEFGLPEPGSWLLADLSPEALHEVEERERSHPPSEEP